MQAFKQRFWNFLQYLMVRILIMGPAASPAERELSARFGCEADGSWSRRSTAPALICSGDWALEYTFPVPPKVHVSAGAQMMQTPSFHLR